MTLTATPDPNAGLVELHIDDAAGVSEILRSDVNGLRPIRTHAGELPRSGGIILRDREAALSGPILYRSAVGDAWTEIGAERPRFTVPQAPGSSVIAEMVTAYNAGRRSSTAFLPVIGREHDPVVIEGRLGLRSGRLDAWFETHAGAQDLETLLDHGRVVMFRQADHAGQDMYLRAESTEISPDEDGWRCSVAYVEAPYPAGDIVTAKSWTFNALTVNGGSFDAVIDDYASFRDLALGEQS